MTVTHPATRPDPRPAAGRAGALPGQAPPDTQAREVAWAEAIEVGVLARAAREGAGPPCCGDATEEELRVLEEAGAAARAAFVAANLGLVGAVLGGCARRGAPVADLFQEGCLGLITAVERFDHRRGVRFSTYATYWIRTSMDAAVSRAGAMTIPAGRADQLRVAHGVESALTQELGRAATVAEVASAIGRGRRWTAGLLGQRATRSLDDLDDRALVRHALPGAETQADDEDAPVVWARRLLAGLDGFDRAVLERRLGFGDREPASLAAVARQLDVPVGRVRRAEARALEQLRGRCPRAVVAGAA